MHRIFDNERYRHPCILLAYIVLPPVTDPGILESADHDPRWPAFSICSWAFMDPIPEPTPKQKELFQAVLKTLRLQPMHPNLLSDPDLEEDFEVPGE